MKIPEGALLNAAIRGDIGRIKSLVDQGADKEKQDKLGFTPLAWASLRGDLEVVRTPLALAVVKGHLEVVRYLIEQDADGTRPLLSSNSTESAKSVTRAKGFHDKLVEKYAAKEDPKWFIPPEAIAKVSSISLAEGAGEVYRAKWANSAVVVKEVPMAELRLFLNELNMWRNLRHANVVPFYGANHLKEPCFIVFQYAAQGELVGYLKREKEKGRILVWRKLKEVAAGLGYLHSQGIAHGDLKGNNVVVSENGIAMLTGLLSLERMKGELGAIAWQAPKYMRMAPQTRKSDVYSFGMSVIEAVTFKNPLNEYSNAETRQFLRNLEVTDKVNKPDEMTEPQWKLVKQMIAISPDDRPNLADVIQKLEEFANDEEMEEDHGRTVVKDLMEKTKYQVTQDGDAKKAHDVVGMTATRRKLLELIAEANKKSPFLMNPVLLHGPPGTGKSFITTWIAAELGRDVVEIKCQEAPTRHLGGTKARILACFQRAVRVKPPAKKAVVVVDELENWHSTLYQYFITLLGDTRSPHSEFYGLVVVATTSYLDRVDTAVLDRMTVVHVPLPSEADVKILLPKLCSDREPDLDVSKVDWNHIASIAHEQLSVRGLQDVVSYVAQKCKHHSARTADFEDAVYDRMGEMPLKLLSHPDHYVRQNVSLSAGKTKLTCPECEWIASDGDSFCRMCGFYLLTDAVFA